MSALPDRPFLTKDFSPRGGGIDFLGLRYVNLHLVGTKLIPELNNVTRDMGTFCLGAWIPWRFAKTCEEGRKKADFTETNYREFRERIEVAISLTMLDKSTATQQHGAVRNRVGTTQECDLPSVLSFKNASRSKENTLYAAAIYGPALRALALLDRHSPKTEDGHVLNIPLATTDADALTILETLDRTLAKAPAYRTLTTLEPKPLAWPQIDALGQAGLCPSTLRSNAFKAIKPCFQRKLLPDDPASSGYARTKTTQLLLATLHQRPDITTDAIRNAWYTGLFDDGTKVKLPDDDLREHCAQWSFFMARQYQRYAIELFLWCFEIALSNGCRSIDGVIKYWADRTRAAGQTLDGTFRDIMEAIASNLLTGDDLKTSLKWNGTVHGAHDSMEHVDSPQGDTACLAGLRMFAGWYWRMLCREKDEAHKDIMALGQSDRIGMAWFLEWLRTRQQLSVPAILKDIFSDLVFSQHMRVALSRFDGHAQRLRFVLGDSGIEPTVSAKGDLGKRALPWMPDRLHTLTALLCDIDVLEMGQDDTIHLGPRANTVKGPDSPRIK